MVISPVQHEQAAEHEDRDLRERRDRFEQRLVARLQAGGAQPRAVEALRRTGEAVQLARLLPERLDHSYAGDAFVDDLRDVTLALLAVPGGGEHSLPHPVRDGEQRGQHDRARAARAGARGRA